MLAAAGGVRRRDWALDSKQLAMTPGYVLSFMDEGVYQM